MFVHDHPLTVSLAIANCESNRQLLRRSARITSGATYQSGAERYAISRSNIQLTKLKTPE